MNHNTNFPTLVDPTAVPKQMSNHDLALLGIEDIAYIRTVKDDNETLFVICAADGTHLATIKDREVAFATVRQNDLEPISVH